jgi:hypothetical protein
MTPQRMEPQRSPLAPCEVGNPRVGFAWRTDSHGRMDHPKKWLIDGG